MMMVMVVTSGDDVDVDAGDSPGDDDGAGGGGDDDATPLHAAPPHSLTQPPFPTDPRTDLMKFVAAGRGSRAAIWSCHFAAKAFAHCPCQAMRHSAHSTIGSPTVLVLPWQKEHL